MDKNLIILSLAEKFRKIDSKIKFTFRITLGRRIFF
jgi:hypothetical protein